MLSLIFKSDIELRELRDFNVNITQQLSQIATQQEDLQSPMQILFSQVSGTTSPLLVCCDHIPQSRLDYHLHLLPQLAGHHHSSLLHEDQSWHQGNRLWINKTVHQWVVSLLEHHPVLLLQLLSTPKHYNQVIL